MLHSVGRWAYDLCHLSFPGGWPVGLGLVNERGYAPNTATLFEVVNPRFSGTIV